MAARKSRKKPAPPAEKTYVEIDSYDMTPLYGRAALARRSNDDVIGLRSTIRQAAQRRPVQHLTMRDHLQYLRSNPLTTDHSKLWQRRLLAKATDTYGKALELLHVSEPDVTMHKFNLYVLGPVKYFKHCGHEAKRDILPNLKMEFQNIRRQVSLKLRNLQFNFNIALERS